jgi:hypothetical protein
MRLESLAKARERLDGNVAVQSHIARAVDFAHAVGAKGREDFVRAELVAYGEWHVRDSVKCIRSDFGLPWCCGVERTLTGFQNRSSGPP